MQHESSGAPLLPRSVRTHGIVRATFLRGSARTGAGNVYQAGGLRLMFPRSAERCEAVVINTGGGIAGGDRWDLAFAAGPGARATVTSQSAERVYRAQGDAAVVRSRIDLAAGADFEWLPQETIFFDAARLERAIEVDMAADASLIMLEAIVFGRASMGERVSAGDWRERWRVRRAGRLIFADDVRLADTPQAILDRAACGGGACALATVLVIAPDAEARLEPARAALDALGPDVTGGASAWDGKLVARFTAASGAALRRGLTVYLRAVRGRPLPRVWQ